MHRAVSAEFLKAWQAFADRVADAAQVPAALVMRVWPSPTHGAIQTGRTIPT